MAHRKAAGQDEVLILVPLLPPPLPRAGSFASEAHLPHLYAGIGSPSLTEQLVLKTRNNV